MKDTIQKFKEQINAFNLKLAAPVLDGTPYLLEMHRPDGSKLIYGTPYSDQEMTTRYGFRLQRSFDLCGALSMSKADADGIAVRLNKNYEAEWRQAHSPRLNQSAPPVQTYVQVIHQRAWMERERDDIKEMVKMLEAAEARMPEYSFYGHSGARFRVCKCVSDEAAVAYAKVRGYARVFRSEVEVAL